MKIFFCGLLEDLGQ